MREASLDQLLPVVLPTPCLQRQQRSSSRAMVVARGSGVEGKVTHRTPLDAALWGVGSRLGAEAGRRRTASVGTFCSVLL